MIRPANFGFNVQTAYSNAFQSPAEDLSPEAIAARAIHEFDGAVKKLRDQGIHVHVVEDSPQPVKPDAIFPNNWFTTHLDGTLVTYPLQSPNRRTEVRDEIISEIQARFFCERTLTLEQDAGPDEFLEGTGSLILDRPQRIAYACRSVRTHDSLIDRFCDYLDYRPFVFDAIDESGTPIYHTNVALSIGEQWAVVCLQAIPDATQRESLRSSLEQSNREVIDISLDQVSGFAANVLQLKRDDDRPLVVMSSTALEQFGTKNLDVLQRSSELLAIDIPTIETYGGGGIRCMMAEIFLKPR